MENLSIIVKKETILQKIIKIFWIFLIGSVIGYIVEMIVGLVQNGHFVSRQGLLYGPFIQVYGLGLAVYYIVISKIKDRNCIKIFFLSMLLGGIIEYLFSFSKKNSLELYLGIIAIYHLILMEEQVCYIVYIGE